MSTVESIGDSGIGRKAGALFGGGGRADRQPMKRLRFAILALLLLLAQSAALFHYVDHLKPDADEADGHACVFCLAAHNLESPVPTPATTLAGPLLHVTPPTQEAWFSCARRLSPACARAPPTA
ncbi:hypothetical protein [Accumulibacter sp.]|uniref:DUF2946 domain-containing protein n=1 Tax=Accumulibacter regalis TaxID=522306 RepID=C7RND5_ACCRE|nr:hypothetical protein [Accumulibacter sp.]MBO3717218.1 hypothetical protein [Accumulibacter sp.]